MDRQPGAMTRNMLGGDFGPIFHWVDIQCAVYSEQCVVCSLQCVVYSVQCVVCSVQCVVCSAQSDSLASV